MENLSSNNVSARLVKALKQSKTSDHTLMGRQRSFGDFGRIWSLNIVNKSKNLANCFIFLQKAFEEMLLLFQKSQRINQPPSIVVSLQSL